MTPCPQFLMESPKAYSDGAMQGFVAVRYPRTQMRPHCGDLIRQPKPRFRCSICFTESRGHSVFPSRERSSLFSAAPAWMCRPLGASQLFSLGGQAKRPIRSSDSPGEAELRHPMRAHVGTGISGLLWSSTIRSRDMDLVRIPLLPSADNSSGFEVRTTSPERPAKLLRSDISRAP